MSLFSFRTSPRRLRVLPVLTGLVLGATLAPAGAFAGEAAVAVAANFTSTVQKLAESFEAETGNKIVLSSGSTGQLYAQITQGAPFDVFLAADEARPLRLEKEGKAASKPFAYATGQLALWSADAATVPADGARYLASGKVERLAIANPKLAPYGLAAKETLTKLGLWDKYQDKIVMGQNIAQTFQIAASKGAPVGFVALSQVLGAPADIRGSHWIVPAEMHTPIRQDAVLLKRGEDNPAAQAFIAYLTAPASCKTIAAAGYQPGAACK